MSNHVVSSSNTNTFKTDLTHTEEKPHPARYNWEASKYLASPSREGPEMHNIAHNFKHDPYESRLKAIKLPSLKLRRKRSDMILGT